jgi:protein phosphatase
MSGEPEVRIAVSARTDRGRTRDHNEDTFLVGDLARGTTEFVAGGQATIGSRGTIFLVADGMGGAAAGELASAMAADIIFNHLRAAWAGAPDPSGDEFIREMRAAVELANDRIHAYAREHPDARGMGTTATVVGVLGRRLHLAQVGDSRAYLIRRSEAVQLTKDQSLMQRLIDAGELTEEQAAHSERRNIILQALGPDPKIRADVTYQDLARGDVLILCSDGLSGQVKREEIGALAAEATDLDALCEHLIELANARGGPDNITVVAARFDGPGLPEAAGSTDLGYHAYPIEDAEATADNPAPVAAADPPPPSEPAAEPPAAPASRSGAPVTIGLIGVGVLVLLFALYLLLS